jgi:hypothetical protein
VDHISHDQNFDRTTHNHGRTYITLGWIFAITSIFLLPFVFGPLGIAMGLIAKSKGAQGKRVITFSIVFAIIGLLLQAITITFFRTFLGVMTTIY